MVEQKNLTQSIEQNFARYAGSVILDRAICDARDMLKPAARMLIYSQMKVSKNVPSKPFVKSARVVGDCLGHFYTHGDASCYSTYMRMAKPFAMRYPLEDCQGNSGTVVTTDDHAAARYTELRLAPLTANLYGLLEKNTIGKWNENFDETEQFPTVFPSIGFYNIVNGTTGIGVAMSSSVPQFNLREVNQAICTLIDNPNASFEEIVCLPDFATGGILTNPNQVKESLRVGNGKSCRLRAVMDYDPNTRTLNIRELPYGVYTDTITDQLRKLTEENEHYGIDGVHDGSGQTVKYSITLSKGANPKAMIKKLYHDTSLEYWVSINMTMLDKGRFPKVFGWREALLAHIDHSAECLRKAYEYDLDKLFARQEILSGLLQAIAHIDDIVRIIRGSNSTTEAGNSLREKYNFTDSQIKAILDLKLQRLVNLEGAKIQKEYDDNRETIAAIEECLANKAIFNEKLKEHYQKVADTYGDQRRTAIDVVVDEEEMVAETPEEDLTAMILSNDVVRLVKPKAMVGSKRGAKGNTLKLPKNAALVDTINTTNRSNLYVITRNGKLYSGSLLGLDEGDYSIYELMKIPADDKIVKVLNGTNWDFAKYLVLATRQGTIKKTSISELPVSTRGTTAIKLRENDVVVNGFLVHSENEEILILTNRGYYNRYEHTLLTPTGKTSMGVKAVALKDGDYVVAALPITNPEAGLFTIISNGRGKITSLSEYRATGRAARGSVAHKLDEGTALAAAAIIDSNSTSPINVINNDRLVTLAKSDIPNQGRATVGVKIINVKDDSNIHIV